MKKHFTVIELVILLSCLGGIASFFSSTTFFAMRTARKQACRGQLRSMSIAALAYECENAGKQLITENRAPVERFGRLVHIGMIDNAAILRCPECNWKRSDKPNVVEIDFERSDFGGEDNPFQMPANRADFVNNVDYSIVNCKIPSELINHVAHISDGFHDVAKPNHINSGNFAYKAGNVINVAGPEWMLQAAGAQWNNPECDSSLMLY